MPVLGNVMKSKSSSLSYKQKPTLKNLSTFQLHFLFCNIASLYGTNFGSILLGKFRQIRANLLPPKARRNKVIIVCYVRFWSLSLHGVWASSFGRKTIKREQLFQRIPYWHYIKKKAKFCDGEQTQKWLCARIKGLVMVYSKNFQKV